MEDTSDLLGQLRTSREGQVVKGTSLKELLWLLLCCLYNMLYSIQQNEDIQHVLYILCIVFIPYIHWRL